MGLKNLLFSRREFIKKTGFGASAMVLPRLNFCTKKSPEKPNIIFIMADQWRGDYLGAAGADWIQTPNLDQIASEGAIFTKAYTSTPSCTPARSALLTGMSPWGHGLLGYDSGIARYKREKPTLLGEAGYHTVGIGMHHYDPKERGYNESATRGDYTKWFEKMAPGKEMNPHNLGLVDHRAREWPHDEHLHLSYWTADHGIKFLENYQGEKPYFMKLSFHRPHPEIDPPKRWFDYYKEKGVPDAYIGEWADRKYGHISDIQPENERRNDFLGNFGEEVIRESRAGYCGSISFVDEQIGRFIKTLEKRGNLENSLILFAVDHGDMMGDHHHWRKTYAYEGSAKIPMIIRWPESMKLNAERGQNIRELVELRDVLPTFLDAAGFSIPKDMEGESMLGLIKGNKQGWRNILDLEHSQFYWDENNWTALTDGRYKYIYFATDGDQQLFDLDNDPGELHNLAEIPEHAELLQTWRHKMVEHLSVRGEPWVIDGDLGMRSEGILYGHNHPNYIKNDESV